MRYVLFALALCSVTFTTQAALIVGAASGLTSPATTITFSEVGGANHTVLASQYTGITFTNSWLTDDNFDSSGPQWSHTNTRYLSNWDGSNCGLCVTPVTMTFSSLQNDIAFLMGSNGTGSVSIFNGATLIDSFFVASNFNGGWYGFQGSGSFDRVEISMNSANNFFALDNLQLNSRPTEVPEPVTFALLGLGLAGIGLSRKKCKA